jgi:hypothetical protein
MNPVAGYIYVLKPNLTIGGNSIVKIGMTTRSVTKRVRELSTGSPVALELIYSLHVENPKGVERHLHCRFAAHRVSNGGGTEYFRVEAKEVIAEIERLAAQASKQRARAARDAELRKYKEEIGAGRLERLIEKISLRAALSCFGTCLALAVLKYGWGMLALAFFPGFAVVGLLHWVISSVLTKRWFLPRFGDQIAAKLDELRPRFPLAYLA